MSVNHGTSDTVRGATVRGARSGRGAAAPSTRGGDARGGVQRRPMLGRALALGAAVLALLITTVRFPPADLSGMLAGILGLPVAGVVLLCAALCVGGLWIAHRIGWRPGMWVNGAVGAVLLVVALWAGFAAM